MSKLKLENLRDCLQAFDFKRLFIEELGWSKTRGMKPITVDVTGARLNAIPIAELSGVVVFMVEDLTDRVTRLAIQQTISQHVHENLVIFVDGEKKPPTQSLWLWVKRDGGKRHPREHCYVRGQPGDLFISKIAGMVVDINELDEQGQFPLAQLVARMKSSLDVQSVTNQFYRSYDEERSALTLVIEGIPDEHDRRWYASVLMHRLMFIWFLQRKGFLDGGNLNYLTDKLQASQQRGRDFYFKVFLKALFFEGFAKPSEARAESTRQLLGDIRYLNGGLFLPHPLERKYGVTLHVPDRAFETLFQLYAGYSWNLNDSPGGLDNEINPDVLGYIFEKYINDQKAFGAYYTRPEITEYLCERSIHRLILTRVNAESPFALPLETASRQFHSIADLLLNLDAELCRELLFRILPELKLLDPACGSGAFLVAAMKTLINIYSAIVGRIKFLNDGGLNRQLTTWEREHKSLAYFIKRRIITDNLFGVDLMEEAIEIAKLRLFLALVASARTVDQLEPLPNIDFNILPGNSLIGLLRVDAHEFEGKHGAQDDLFRKSYRQTLDEKNRNIHVYRDTVTWADDTNLGELKLSIEQQRRGAQITMDEVLLDQWHRSGIKFEQATWDVAKGKPGKPDKRTLTLADMEALRPFHWGFEFDEILNQRGGFDAIITNPPWEIFKPNAKEFFEEHSELVSKNKMTIKAFEKEQTKLLENTEIRTAWLEYLSRFPHVSAWFRAAPQYRHQSAVVNGKKTGSDINLYKLFTEQCYNLLRDGGDCGIVIPSGIYTDLGAKGLRDMLLDECQITALFGLSNEKYIFEEVHHAQKFCLLVFEKGGRTSDFEAAFRINPREAIDPSNLGGFLNSPYFHLTYSTSLINTASPDSRSLMEFRYPIDINIAKTILRHPQLRETSGSYWKLKLSNEFHMTNDSHLFRTGPSKGRLPLCEGKQFHQFIFDFAEPRYWLDEAQARVELMSPRLNALRRELKKKGLLDKLDQSRILLDYESYRLAFRDVSASTNERTVIATILPPKRFCPHTVSLECVYHDAINEQGHTSIKYIDHHHRLYLTSLFNSFIFDWFIRQSITAHVSFFFVYNTPLPRISPDTPRFHLICSHTAKLICTTPEFDNLAKEVGLKSHRDGATDPAERARLRAELDGLIAHLYGLTEAEFAHVLATFPLVAEPVKIAALNAWRDVERGLIK